jgi:hypothetical protein
LIEHTDFDSFVKRSEVESLQAKHRQLIADQPNLGRFASHLFGQRDVTGAVNPRNGQQLSF